MENGFKRNKRFLRVFKKVTTLGIVGIAIFSYVDLQQYVEHEPQPLNQVEYYFPRRRALLSAQSIDGCSQSMNDGGHQGIFHEELPYEDCEIPSPIRPQTKIQTTYAASFPGSGARLTWSLIESLTGLWTGDDRNSNRRGKKVVSIKTHYPHRAGNLAHWDGEITRAFIMIRNPMYALPDYFNNIYQTKHEIPLHSQNAPVEAWIAWRDRLLTGQVKSFCEFIRYWMKRYGCGNIIVISYEALLDEKMGPEETARLASFLQDAEGVTIDMKAIPCIWRKIVEPNAEAVAPTPIDCGKCRIGISTKDETKGEGFYRRLQTDQYDPQRLGPIDSPYTPDQLDFIASVLQELAAEFKDHPYLHGILIRYHLEVTQASFGPIAGPFPSASVTNTKEDASAKSEINESPEPAAMPCSKINITKTSQGNHSAKPDDNTVSNEEKSNQLNVNDIEKRLTMEFSPQVEDPEAEDPEIITVTTNDMEPGDKGDLIPINPYELISPHKDTSKRLYYCGSTGPSGKRHSSIYGIFIVNSIFPEIIGGSPRLESGPSAILLTKESLKNATENDFLVHHMHQYCEVNVLKFPGLQLHVNAEYYDMHPESARNKDHNGKFTLHYLPPSKKIFVLGPHQTGTRSIRLPYAMMKWWVLAKGDKEKPNYGMLKKFFNHSAKPRNTQERFLLYANSHYVEFREMAAHQMSQISPIHVLGSCQGNINAKPILMGSRPAQCQPFKDDERPPSIVLPPESLTRGERGRNRLLFSHYRFVILMENTNSDGYVSEKIVDGFMSGTIPIYYGTKQVFDIFNPKAFIYYDIEKPQEAIDRVAYLENNPDEYNRMMDEPILANGDHTIEKYFSFDDSIGNGTLKKRLRRKMGFPV